MIRLICWWATVPGEGTFVAREGLYDLVGMNAYAGG